MQDRPRQDVVVDLRDLTAEERKRFLGLQIGILKARQREAEADWEASQHWAKRSAACREQEERKLAEQKAQEEHNQKYRDLIETREQEWLRPSKMHYAEITYDEERKQYSATRDGVTAYGNSPEMACDNFDHLWLYGN